MIVLGLDSASTCGWAVVESTPERLLEHGAVDARDHDEIERLADYVVSKYCPRRAAIEDSYLGDNVATVKLLSRLVGRWEQALALRSVKHEIVMADVWQQGVLGGLISRRSKRAERKAACVRWVRATYGIGVAEDPADAIGLATWMARREEVARRLVGRGARL